MKLNNSLDVFDVLKVQELYGNGNVYISPYYKWSVAQKVSVIHPIWLPLSWSIWNKFWYTDKNFKLIHISSS